MQVKKERCDFCEGKGRISGHECPVCKGAGYVDPDKYEKFFSNYKLPYYFKIKKG